MIGLAALLTLAELQSSAVWREQHPVAMPASVPPAPPAPATTQSLLAWLPGEVRCGGAMVAAAPMRRPWTTLSWSIAAPAMPVTYAFSIDASGRTTGIHRVGGNDYVVSGDDIAPSLAATRFAAGAPRSDCRVAYAARQTALADTPLTDLISYTVTPRSGALPEAGWARIKADGTCADAPRPEPLVQVSPDYRALPATPGVKDWSMVAYDLDAKGRPIAVRLAESTGNRALDAAAMKAMAAWRFTAGTARHGCLYPYWRVPATLPAPPIPEEDAFRPAGATCPSHHEWSVMPTLRFPEPYAQRSIEGWAIVTYDVAPWGEIGNAHVVAAEPSEDFGTAALEVVRSARVPATQGLVGCVDRVRFRMPAPTVAGMTGVTPPPS